MATLSSFDEVVNRRGGQLTKLAASLQPLFLGPSKESCEVGVHTAIPPDTAENLTVDKAMPTVTPSDAD